MRNLILGVIDRFYFLFKSIMDLQTYRYGVCGAANTAFDIFCYFVFYNFIFDRENFELGLITVSPHIAAFIAAFSISFPTGFFIMKTVVFADSKVKGSTQLLRYFSVILLNISLNYILLKVLVEILGLYPTPSKMAITCFIVLLSYILQRKFTFKVSNGTIG